jgi:protein phosphatase
MTKKEEAVEELKNLANERGGSDNISIIVARKEGGK